jgi:hypothetical protein
VYSSLWTLELKSNRIRNAHLRALWYRGTGEEGAES